MKTKYLICNLKENKTLKEILSYKKELEKISFKEKVKLIVCPSYPFLILFQDENYELASQDVSKFEGGAYTGEVSAAQLSSLNVRYAIVSHYERRVYFEESEKETITKMKNLIKEDIRPILFFGEMNYLPQEEVLKEIKEKIEKIFCNFTPEEVEKIILAYEPSWAIGTENNLEIDQISKIVDFVKKEIYKKYRKDIPILYGGGVKKEKIKELISIHNLDGLCLGKSSLESKEVESIYKEFI